MSVKKNFDDSCHEAPSPVKQPKTDLNQRHTNEFRSNSYKSMIDTINSKPFSSQHKFMKSRQLASINERIPSQSVTSAKKMLDKIEANRQSDSTIEYVVEIYDSEDEFKKIPNDPRISRRQPLKETGPNFSCSVGQYKKDQLSLEDIADSVKEAESLFSTAYIRRKIQIEGHNCNGLPWMDERIPKYMKLRITRAMLGHIRHCYIIKHGLKGLDEPVLEIETYTSKTKRKRVVIQDSDSDEEKITKCVHLNNKDSAETSPVFSSIITRSALSQLRIPRLRSSEPAVSSFIPQQKLETCIICGKEVDADIMQKHVNDCLDGGQS